MVDASKILTVSYGTFSCTLEGFDDPFSTMRGIAEYFRDLAAEDRYFGAEPPTPDAEMLHRIAEREVQKRVEARVGDDSITLRQLDETPSEATPASEIHTDAEPVVAPAATPAPIAQSDTADTPVSRTETVAAKLARLRALTAEDEYDANGDVDIIPNAIDTFEVEPITSAFDDVPEVEAQSHAPAERAEPEEMVSIRDLVNEIQEESSEETESSAESSASEEPEAVEVDQSATEDDAPTLDPEIEAVAETPEGSEPSVEEMDNAVFTETETAEQQAEAELAETADDEPTDDETVEEDPVTSFIGSALAETEEEESQQADDGTEEPDAAAIARVVKMRRADFEAAQGIEPAPVAGVEADDLMAGLGSPVPGDADHTEISADLSDEPSEDAEQEFDDAEEEVAETVLETEISEENDDTPVSDTEEEISTLSDEDEADLMATLETVKRQEAADMRAEKEGRALLEKQDIESSADSVSRILDVTNTEMEETEGTRRRSAIAHLKAAVAATRADRLLGLGKAQEEKEELDKYRDDLAKAVRPRRPSTGDKPKARRQAPLVLVSEQRIDEEDTPPVPSDAEAVMPRRVRTDELSLDDAGPDGENIFRDGHSFADFAAEMGAKELPDLLEAAAAYSSFVEGQETFSRPQIMKAVAGLNEEQEFSREESLRSFGLLLRRGKIKKIKRGQFTIAETTRFNPEVRAVGE